MNHVSRFKSHVTSLLLVACAAVLVDGTAKADDKKVGATGTWTWTVPARNGGPDRTNTLTLKVDGEKLSGTLTTPRRDSSMDTPITDGKVTGDEVSFTVVREFNGNTMTSKYTGKVNGDRITGKIEFERNGDTQTRDWNAKRGAPMAMVPAAGAAEEEKPETGSTK